MSLLLDALKKTGAAQHSAAQGNTSNGGNTAPAVASARAAGQNLFAAKTLPTHIKGRLGIIPLALIGGLLLAAGGGYYLWRAISPVPALSRPSAAAPLMQPTPLTSPVAESTPQPSLVATRKTLPVRAPVSRRATAQSSSSVQIKTDQSDTVNSTLLSAYQAYRSGDFGTAWQLYRSVLQQDARNRDALLGLAAIAQYQGQEAIAVQYYNQVLLLDPRDPVAQAGLSGLGTSDVATRESRLKSQINHSPDAAVLYYALGNLYAEQSRWSEARLAYEHASTREPDNAQFIFNLAVSLDHLGLSKLAAQHYQRALALERTGNASFDHTQAQQRITELTAH
ncbi:MAG: hypothetical protein Q7S51_00975 [Gallionellaceae bacterium]|nr:hypothetical protein [Gallionellaceae bacterium]